MGGVIERHGSGIAISELQKNFLRTGIKTKE